MSGSISDTYLLVTNIVLISLMGFVIGDWMKNKKIKVVGIIILIITVLLELVFSYSQIKTNMTDYQLDEIEDAVGLALQRDQKIQECQMLYAIDADTSAQNMTGETCDKITSEEKNNCYACFIDAYGFAEDIAERSDLVSYYKPLLDKTCSKLPVGTTNQNCK